jgi:tRNA (guanosine-2'-O-)-methyltransferase
MSRREKLSAGAARRLKGVRLVLENIEDAGNRAAIMNSVEAFGLCYVDEVGDVCAETENAEDRQIVNSGEEWLRVTRYADARTCVEELKRLGYRVLVAMPPSPTPLAAAVTTTATTTTTTTTTTSTTTTVATATSIRPLTTTITFPDDISLVSQIPTTTITSPDDDSLVSQTTTTSCKTLESIDFSSPVALVVGNERYGISPEMRRLADSSFAIPMYGFSESYSISVTVAVCLHHARHASAKARHVPPEQGDLDEEEQEALLQEYEEKQQLVAHANLQI